MLNEQIIYNANAFTVFKGHEIIEKNIKNLKSLPFDGLICCNDELALGAMNALKRIGI